MANVIKYPKSPRIKPENILVKLIWYRKHSDTLAGEESLNKLTIHDLQDIFDVYIDNIHLNYWHVKTRHARALQRITKHNIAINKFMYFVEQRIII